MADDLGTSLGLVFLCIFFSLFATFLSYDVAEGLVIFI